MSKVYLYDGNNEYDGALEGGPRCSCGVIVKNECDKCAECAAGEAEFRADLADGR